MSSTTVTPMGRLSENFMGLQDNAPAVILNPDAHPLAVLAWCWGEVESLSEAAGVYASAEAGRDGVADSGNAFNAIFTHRLQHLPRVMGLAIHALMDDRDCMAAVLSDEEGADQ